MKITVEGNVEKEDELKFPCLMKYKDIKTIIIASGRTERGFKGVIVGSSNPHLIGKFSEGWSTYGLVPFNGKITLQND
jgi:hypothetical protein